MIYLFYFIESRIVRLKKKTKPKTDFKTNRFLKIN